MNREKRNFADDANLATKHCWKGSRSRVAGQWNGWCRAVSTKAEHVQKTHPHCTSTQTSPKNNTEQRELGGLCKYHLKSIRRDNYHVRNELAKRQEQIRKHHYSTPRWNCSSMVVCFLAMELQESWAELESIQDEERWATASTKMEKQASRVERSDRSRRFSKGLSDHDWHRKKQIGTGCSLVLLRIRGTWWCCHTRRFKPTEGSTFSYKA